jgi:excinuclease ABC subunit C
VGKRRRLASRLDDVPGIGPKTRKALLTGLGSIDAIRSAPDEAILAIKGVNRSQLDALRKHLGREGDADDGVVEEGEDNSLGDSAVGNDGS